MIPARWPHTPAAVPALLAALVLSAWASPSPGGYRDLARDLESYRPTPLYEAYSSPAPAAPAAAPRARDGFAAQVEALEAARGRWEKALQAGVPQAPFYLPDPARLERLRPAAGDDGAAARALGDGFALEDLEVLAWLRNPGVRAAERELRGALERYTQAWGLDEILRQYTAFTEALMTGVGPMKGREPVAMRFPFPGVLALKGEIVGQEVRAASESVELARRRAVTAARKAYWNLGFVIRARQITGQMVGLLERLEAVARTRYETGRTSFQDVIKVRIRRESLQEDLETLAQRAETLRARILEILDLPPATAVGAPAGEAPPAAVPELAPLYDLALERRQELRRLRAKVGKMERMIELAETRIYPAYSLNLSLYADEAVARVGTARTGEPFAVATTASMGAGLPKMPWYATGDAYVRETRQRLEALRARLRGAEARVRFEVRTAWSELDRAAREAALYGQSIVSLSQAALEVSTRGYETGKVGFADVTASYTTWLKANLTLARKRADLGVARAELDRAVGVAGAGRSTSRNP